MLNIIQSSDSFTVNDFNKTINCDYLKETYIKYTQENDLNSILNFDFVIKCENVKLDCTNLQTHLTYLRNQLFKEKYCLIYLLKYNYHDLNVNIILFNFTDNLNFQSISNYLFKIIKHKNCKLTDIFIDMYGGNVKYDYIVCNQVLNVIDKHIRYDINLLVKNSIVFNIEFKFITQRKNLEGLITCSINSDKFQPKFTRYITEIVPFSKLFI